MGESGKYERNLGLEFLKILSMFGILILHLFGIVFHDTNLSRVNLLTAVLINSIFNIGVSCFALISGYFGVRLSYKKTTKLWSVIWFYSVISGCIAFFAGGG